MAQGFARARARTGAVAGGGRYDRLGPVNPGGRNRDHPGERQQWRGVQQSAQTISVPVRATILANPPNLAVAPQALLFRSTEGLDVLQQALLVDNTGGPQLMWQSEISVESGDWLSLSRVSGEAPTRTIVSQTRRG
ncbi:MAG: hypothetical protein R2748_20715 [Bryobacterales bacterium]